MAGPLVPWGTCSSPGRGADCAFSTTVINAPGADLSGIDLRGARLEDGSDLSGANLSGALLDEAEIFADLDSADLSGVVSRDTSIYGSLARAQLAGAGLLGWRVDSSYFGAASAPDQAISSTLTLPTFR